MSDTLELSPDDEAIPRALQWLEDIAEREGWSPATAFGLTLSLDEALANVVSYAFDPSTGSAAPAAITLECRRDGSLIEVELRDNGRAYDPTGNPPAALVTNLDDAEIGGHGIRLMRHYLHDLVYKREAGWNCLTLVMETAP
ncbi:MAG: ATP-binding protein [Bordetella sp.]|uniref:ATP-binding protein n=1 Tax=Bordetella sp. TaxID=28081 RepID=UPI003F7BAF38